jgi:gamma-glutamylcyclotransferase (GGCT)/AIG2-like uncharacterized protein YtfP
MPYYFAYGSNLSFAQMAQRCPGATPLGKACLKGWRYLIYERGYANIVPDAASEVWGGVWLVTEDHLRALDGFEGVTKGLYHRVDCEVELEGDAHVRCVVYIDSNPSGGIPGVPKADYQARILAGAHDFSLPEAYIAFLETFAD